MQQQARELEQGTDDEDSTIQDSKDKKKASEARGARKANKAQPQKFSLPDAKSHSTKVWVNRDPLLQARSRPRLISEA